MKKLVVWEELEARAYRFRKAAQKFRVTKSEKLSFDENFAWETFKDYFLVPSEQELVGLVRVQSLNRDWVPRGNKLLLVTPNTGKTTGIVALFWAYMSGIEQIRVRPGRDDTWTGKFVEYLNEEDSRVELEDFERLSMARLERKLEPYDMIVVYGSRETIDRFRLSALGAEVVSYGPKMSIAVHERKEFFKVDQYYRDIAMYDGLGCLNTSILYTLHWNDEIKEGIQELALKLEKLAERNPVVVQNWQVESSLRDDFVEMWGPVVRRTSRKPLGSHHHMVDDFLPTGYGTLHVVKIDSEEDLLNEWKGYQRSCLLSSATLLSGIYERPHWISVLSECGASRVVWPGDAQSPKLTWENGGTNPLRSLVRTISGN